MEVRETNLPGVLVLKPKRHGDARGYFFESYNRRTLQGVGLNIDFVQDNQSYSAEANTVRGMHFQAPPHAQSKLVSCLRGSLFDAVVDVRKGSPTYGERFGIELTPENGLQLFVPKGFLHGFATRAPDTVIAYKVDDHYDSGTDGSVRWDTCGIDWNLTGEPVLSDKDSQAVPLDQFDSPFTWENV